MLTMAFLSVLIAWRLDHNRMETELLAMKLCAGDYETRWQAFEDLALKGPTNDRSLIRTLVYETSDPDLQIAFRADQCLRKVSGMRQGYGDIRDHDTQALVFQKWATWYVDTYVCSQSNQRTQENATGRMQ